MLWFSITTARITNKLYLYIISIGRRNRTLHLYVVTATNLVFKVQIQSQRRDVAQRADRTSGGCGG
jgi:hypothetical protein